MHIGQTLKQKKIYVMFGIAVLITVVCIIQMLLPKQQYLFYGEHSFTEGVAESAAVIYEQVVLPPGVYDVVLEYDSDTSLKNLCFIEDGTVFTGGLLTNGEHLHKNLESTNFRMWLFESTEAMQVKILYGGQGALTTGNLTFYETNTLWTLILTIVWSLTLCFTAVFAFLKYDKVVGVEKEKKNIIFGLFLIILIASIPNLQNANMASGDLVYHLNRIEGVKDSIKSGQFPLRIEPEWLFNHGYANAVFYCSTLLYFPAILRLLGFTVTTGYNMYCIALNIGTALIAYFCFRKIFKDRYIGLLCSGLYTLSIVRIYNMCFRAAVGEYSAIAFMPLVLYGLYRAFTEDVKSKKYKTAWIPIAIGYAGLIQTHVLSCEITAFLTIIICVVMMKKVFVKETFLVLAKGALAAALASCWYLVPFLDYYLNENMHIRYVSARTIQERGVYLAQVFFNWWKFGDTVLTNYEGMVESHAMGVGLILGIGLGVFFIFWFSGKWRGEKNSIMGLSKVSWVFGVVLIIMSLNIFPWDKIQHLSSITAPLISSIQFPNRFLSWGTVFLVIVFGSLLWYFKRNGQKWYYYLGVTGVLLSICTSGIYLTDYICRDKEYVYIYNEEGMGFGYISGAEYLVEGTQMSLLDFGVPTASENVEISTYNGEYLHMWVTCTNRGGAEEYVELPLLHYNGYRAYITETGEELATQKGTNNIVRVNLPEGFSGRIEVKFVSPIHWRISELVTYVWWICIGGVGVKHWLDKRKREERKALCAKS